jgi:hypothetical protein
MSTRTNFLTPVGRLVRGSLYKPNEKDADGNPLLVKSGPNKGQPRVDYSFALAIPKTPGLAWHQTEWGKVIASVGFAAFPQAAGSAAFAWKIIDGDDQRPNRKGKKPCDNEGYPGHWVLWFSSGYQPKLYADNGARALTEPNAAKLGDYAQVFGSVAGNDSAQQPGVYLNHLMVNIAGYGAEIVVGPDATAVGFGQGVALPPGASATPTAGAWQPAAGVPGAPAGVSMPAAPAAPSLPAPAMPAAPAPAPIAVPPNPAILAVPPAAPAAPALPMPPAAPVAPAAPVRTMTAKAGGHAYDDLIKAGWTDATLIANGLMLP